MRKFCILKTRLILALLAAGLLLAACQGSLTPGADAQTPRPQPSDTPQPEETPSPAPSETSQPTAQEPTSANPTEGVTGARDPNEVDTPWSAYPPAPGDTVMERGPFFMDTAMLLISNDEAKLSVEGSLPTPCNQPRARVLAPNAQNRIVVELYSVRDRDKMCAEMIKPFAGIIATISGLPSGTYTVVIEEQEIGTIAVP